MNVEQELDPDDARYRIMREEEIDGMEKTLDELPEYDSVISVGLGGSVRGAEAITDALGEDSHYVLNSPEPKRIDSVIGNVENPILHLSSKSGETVETIAMYNYISDRVSEDRTVVTTQRSSRLADFCSDKEITLLETGDISGRFSVFSYYGMVPAYLSGVNVSNICSTARKLMLEDSDTHDLAARICSLSSKDIIYIASYSERLEAFNSWVTQLWSESLGKDESNTHISTGIGPNFHHSRLQRIIQGKDNISVVLIKPTIPNGAKTSVSYDKEVEQISFSELLDASHGQMIDYVSEKDVPYETIGVDLNESSLARLLIVFEIAVIMRGKDRGINVFNQPAVSDTKYGLKDRIQ